MAKRKNRKRRCPFRIPLPSQAEKTFKDRKKEKNKNRCRAKENPRYQDSDSGD